jgi:hypothetical protein
MIEFATPAAYVFIVCSFARGPMPVGEVGVALCTERTMPLTAEQCFVEIDSRLKRYSGKDEVLPACKPIRSNPRKYHALPWE